MKYTNWRLTDSTRPGSTLFVVGGGGSAKGQTVWARINGTERGRKLWALDLAQPRPAWVGGPDLPGTPRSGGTVIAINTSVYVLGGLADSTGLPPKKPVNCSGLNAGASLKTCRATVLDNWVLDTAGAMRWSRLPTNAFSHGGMSPSAVVVQQRYILNLGVDCAAGSAGNVDMCLHGAGAGCTLKPNYGPDTTINTTCLKIPPPETAPIGYCNGITVYDAHLKAWGSVRARSTSEGVALMGPPGCTQQSGLPFNCFSPNVAMRGDQLLLHSGECSPFVLKGANKWHYPTVALSAQVSVLDEMQ